MQRARRTELVAEIRGHIETGLGQEQAAGEAAVRNVLDRLGPPEEIVEAAEPPSLPGDRGEAVGPPRAPRVRACSPDVHVRRVRGARGLDGLSRAAPDQPRPVDLLGAERFDPDRFGPRREEHRKHPLAFIPQGSDPPVSHRCLGLEYSTLLTLAFLAVLVRGYDWQLPPQRLDLDWGKRPPEPRDGLIVQLRSV